MFPRRNALPKVPIQRSMHRRIWLASRSWSHSAAFDERQPTQYPRPVLRDSRDIITYVHGGAAALLIVNGCGGIERSSPRSVPAPLSSSSAMALYPVTKLSISDNLYRRSMFKQSNPLSGLQREGIGVLRAQFLVYYSPGVYDVIKSLNSAG